MALKPYTRRKKTNLGQYLAVAMMIAAILGISLGIRSLVGETFQQTSKTRDVLFEPTAVSRETGSRASAPSPQEGTLLYQLNTELRCRRKSGAVNLQAVNPAESPYYLRFVVTSAEGEELFCSGLLKPGYGVEQFFLEEKQIPEKGYVGEVTVEIEALNIATLEPVGSASCKASLTVPD